MAIAILLGMGMPTTAAYAVAASVVAPGLVELGINQLDRAFLRVLLRRGIGDHPAGCAWPSYAAAGISGANAMETSVASFKIGIAAFIVPFMFFYNGALLMDGGAVEIARALATAVAGVFLLSSGVQGWFMGGFTVWYPPGRAGGRRPVHDRRRADHRRHRGRHRRRDLSDPTVPASAAGGAGGGARARLRSARGRRLPRSRRRAGPAYLVPRDADPNMTAFRYRCGHVRNLASAHRRSRAPHSGGDLLVRGAVRVAGRLGVSPLVIGLTLVGFGTSMPELVTSVKAALVGAPGIAFGNIVGSNIANILLIGGSPPSCIPSR
ncbi:MAG: hypothetical protein ACMVO3_01805 [Thalassobaculum sp.]